VSDFFQNGTITTLHNLGDRPVSEIEEELKKFTHQGSPIALVLPSLYDELKHDALENIIQELQKVEYLNQVIIGLDRATKEEFEHAKQYFSRLPQNYKILWNDGPNLKAVDELLRTHDLAPKELGKGRNVWYCMGYFLASGVSQTLALHDCDITTYRKDLLARLLYPVANPVFGFKFCKGYYYRASTKLNGRVSRLLVTPLIRALKMIEGKNVYLDYMDSFRYPLAGEFCMYRDVVQNIRIPSDWGLEIGVLSEVFRNYSANRICQVDIADTYDHKHQPLSQDDAEKGLYKMSIDICKAFFRKLATSGTVFNEGVFRTLKATYYRTALDFVEKYYADAKMNGLDFDRHSEEQAVELFAQSIMSAGDTYLSNPMETPFMPSWNRVSSAIPGILDKLLEAVEKDSA
jgi:glucosyl-3-phosphoglycerate synthase